MTTINLVDAKKIILSGYRNDEPILLIGPPGIGKTAMIEGVTEEEEIGFIDFRLGMRDPVEVGGMRVPDSKTGELRHYVPDDLPNPKRHGPKGIFLLDEINVVSQMMQATAYGLINERRTGSYRMPKGWVPMASGNNVSDRAAAQRLSTALANRFNVQYVVPDLQSWLDQYGSEHVDSRGTAFLRFRPRLFHLMPWEPIEDPGTNPNQATRKSEEVRFPSARSWTKAFKFIDEEPILRRKIFTGYVGPDIADDFEAYWRIVEKATTFDEVVANPTTARVPSPEDAGTCYAVSGMLARLVDRKTIDPVMVYAENLQPDYRAAMVHDFTRRDPGLKNTQAYGKWAVDNQAVIL